MKRLVTTLGLLAVAGGCAWYFFVYGKTEEPPQIIRAVISRGTIIEAVQATGTLEALRTVQVGPQVSGTIIELNADFNSIVRRGQVVARLDPSLLQTQVDIQAANIERQETDIEMQRVQLEDAERNLARTKELFEKGLANQTQLEQAELAVKTRQAQIAAAEKQLVQARANLAQAELNVSYTEVKSPIDGVVVNRLVDVGQTIQSSMNITPFFEIATDLNTLRLTAGVDEADIGKIRPGMKVEFEVDTYPNTTFHGTVENVNLNATVQSNVVTYPVWIIVPNPDYRLRPSLTANLRIIVNTAEDVLRIPNAALRFRPSAEMFTALGLEPPPQPTRVGRGGGAPMGPNAAAQPAGPAPAPAAQAGAAPGLQPAVATVADAGAPQAGPGRAGRGGRGTFGPPPPQGGAPVPPMAGARGGRQGGRGAGAALQPVALANGGSQTGSPIQSDRKIDEFFAPIEVQPQPGTVWVWDENARTLTDVRVMTGISDGQFSQLVSGDLTEGQEVVTNIILPVTAASAGASQQTIFGQPGGGRGGLGGGICGGRGRGGF
jgi:HlyD family secretion protein